MSEPWSPRPRESVSESLESLGYDPQPRAPVPRRAALIGAGVTLLVAVGGVFGWNQWQGRAADQDLLLALPRPVSETPTLAWSWQAGGDAAAVYAVGDVTLVEQDFDTLIALDAQGEELWTSEIGPDAFIISAPGHDDVFLETSLGGASLRSLDDGETLWARDGQLMRTGDDWVLFHEDDRIREVDLLTGRELWSADASSTLGADSSGVYAVENRRLTKWSHSGEQLWVAAQQETISTSFAAVVPAKGFVALGGEGIVTAYDTDDGKALWTADIGDDDVQVGLLLPDLVYAYQLDTFSEESEGQAPAEVTVLGLDGRVGSLDADGSFFYAYPVDAGYAVDGVSGRFYDSSLKAGGQPLGPVVQPVEGGAYVQNGSDLVFVTPPDGKEEWRLPNGPGLSPQVAVGDRRLVLVVNRTVRAYE